ncbi:MAG: hypothetical protein R2784_03600 [Saprospiraceae bacterium]
MGAFFLSSILINVILQDIFYDVNKGALIAACFYQLSLFVIMYLNKDSIIMAIKALIPKGKSTLFFKEQLWKYGMAFLAFPTVVWLGILDDALKGERTDVSTL